MRSARITRQGSDAGRSPRPGRASDGRAALALAALLALGPGRPARAESPPVVVMLDRAQILRLPPGTETVVVGNPIIADITMLRNSGQLILTGKGFGDTNLLFIDARGTVLADTRLRVSEASATMVVQRGAERETYACHPRCEPTVALGDASAFFGQTIRDVQQRNGLASGAAGTNAPR